MWDWLSSAFDSIWSALGDWGRNLLNAIAAVYSFINWVRDELWRGLREVNDYAWSLYRSSRDFIVSVYHFAEWIVDVAIRDIWDFGRWVYREAINFATSVRDMAMRWIDYAIHFIERTISDLTSWVIRNIWHPLWNEITGIWHWVHVAGDWLYDVVTHPEKLATILASWAYRELPRVMLRFSRPIGRWLIHGMKDRAGEVFDVIEHILAAII
jgi:hypothetical protein